MRPKLLATSRLLVGSRPGDMVAAIQPGFNRFCVTAANSFACLAKNWDALLFFFASPRLCVFSGDLLLVEIRLKDEGRGDVVVVLLTTALSLGEKLIGLKGAEPLVPKGDGQIDHPL